MPTKSNAAMDTPETLVQPAANLLELYHARQLRDRLERHVLRLAEQSCLAGWGEHIGEYEPLQMRASLNADEVRSHYAELLVAMDHLLEQLGEFESER